MAECHPVGFQWVMEAKARGATIIHVDPRFTRTSAMADIHAPIRAGSDIVFLGGIVRYILENDKAFKEYIIPYTNAANIINKEFKDTEELAGFFSGWDPVKGEYDGASWGYEGVEETIPAGGHQEAVPGGSTPHVPGKAVTSARRDETLQHPRCVYQIMRRHFARYTPAMVADVCGVPEELFLRIAEALCKNSGRDRTGAFCYAVGWTHHTVAVQYIRTAAIIQLLLGNMGRPGGGIMALRGHASIQGSTDIPTLFNLLPGYIPMRHPKYNGVDDYLKSNTASAGIWSAFPAYFISLMKAWFGDAATKENGWRFNWLPAITGDHSHMATVADMVDGKVKGYLVMGENPVVGSMNGTLQRKGMAKLDWMVVRDFALTETADFWRTAPEVVSGEVPSGQIGTEVFFFPAAAHTEKEGTFTNTQRLLQWHHKAVEPPGAARSELEFTWKLGKRLKALYAASRDSKDDALRALTWEYPESSPGEPDAAAVLREINGQGLLDGRYINAYTELKDDGTTACGCWIYAGCTAGGVNQTARRKPAREQSYVAPEWGWAWPNNRRMLYNRASADPAGNPWSERKRYVWWDAALGKWTGVDVPDFIADRAPTYRPVPGATGLDAISGTDPFIMQTDGKGWLFAPSGIVDGPLPAHYEPQESVVENALYPQQCNPMRMEWHRRDNPYHLAYRDPRYPFLITTYRLTEHHTAGGMSRWLSWLGELMPEMFCEISPELAAERGLEHTGWATVSTARGEVQCRVVVTQRMRPLRIRGKMVHQIGMPYHWSWIGRVRGDAANDLIGFVADPNVHIQESKVLTGNIVPGRRATARRATLGGSPGNAIELPEPGPLRNLPGMVPFKRQPLQNDPEKE